MNQPAHPVNRVSAPSDRGEALPQTLVADVRCVVKQLALHLGRVVSTRFPALFPRTGIDQARSVDSVRSPHAANLG